MLAVVAALGQGVGSVLAKLGMTGTGGVGAGVEPLSATLIRLVWATVFYWLAVAFRLDWRATLGGLRDRRGVAALAVAIFMGPFISVWISLVAIKNTEAGIAQVLLGTVPIFVVLPSSLVYQDRPTALSLLGIVVAFVGIFLGQVTGALWLDGAASIVIGLILAATAWVLAIETKNLLIGESATKPVIDGIRSLVSAQPDVERVNEVLTMHMGPKFILANLSIDFKDDLTAVEIEDAISRMDVQIKQACPDVQRVFIEAEARKTTTGEEVRGEW